MRTLVLAIATLSLGSCTSVPPPQAPDYAGQARLAQLIAGKVAGPPQRCLSRARADNMIPVDGRTIAFRDGSTIWISRVEGYCPGLDRGYTLVMKPIGMGGPCRGDDAHVVDPNSGVMAGSCLFGDFVPYRALR